MNLTYVFEQGNIVLISVFMLLISMSLTSWYLIFSKLWKIRKEQYSASNFRRQYMNIPDWPKKISDKNIKGCPGILLRELERIKSAAVNHSPEDRKEVISLYLSQKLDLIRVWLDKGLTILASIGSSAPFIGLFGTIWGIYGALTKIAAEGNASLNVVAGPVGEALVATAIGLFAAIPAVLAYNTFLRMNRVLVQDLRHIAEQITIYHSLSVRDKRAPAENIKILSEAR